MKVAEVLDTVRRAAQDDVRQFGTPPADAVYTFDQPAEHCQDQTALAPVIKTRQRTVVSLRFGTVRCREVLRRADGQDRLMPSGLGSFAPAGMRCAYDLIAHVGVDYYLRGHTLGRIQEDLRQRTPAVPVPLSSLYDVCTYFLYLFGQVHQRRAGPLRETLARDGKGVWLLDCTQEADSPAFFGILETHGGVLLGCWKMATENQPDVSRCLRQAVENFGTPGRLLHDLGAVMTGSCAEVLPDVPDSVCHFHLARDIGEDLFRRPHQALGDRLRTLNLQAQLRGQRQDQVDYLRKQVLRGEVVLLLQRLLAGERLEVCWTAALGREVLLAVQFWILDYARDGRRQGYPFDPHLLYLHRRLVRAADALQRLLAGLPSAGPRPECLKNLCRRLQAYRDDQASQDAAAWYEKAQDLFTQVRGALRLAGAGKTPMSETYAISAAEQRDVTREVQGLRAKWQQEAKGCSARAQELYAVVLSHLERYEGKLCYAGAERLNEESDRTTNDLERTWRENKRRCRRRHGRAGVKKDLQAMPAEAMLVGNLEVPEYVAAVLGSWSELPQRLAEVGGGESFRCWKARQRPSKVGQLPRAQLRRQNFLDDLLQVCLPLPDLLERDLS